LSADERGERIAVAFAHDLSMVGFQLAQEKRDGTRTFTLARNRFLNYWLHVPPDGERALFTWEFAIGEYMQDYGLQIGTSEPLNQFLFPQEDQEVEQDLAAVVAAMERVEISFRGMDFGAQGI
jgi:hypothetical protein